VTTRRAVLPLLLLASAAALLYSLYLQTRVAPGKPGSSNPPRYTLDDVDWVRYNGSGQPSLRGHASEIDYYRDRSAIGKGLKITVLRHADTAWIATAPNGEMPAGDQRLRLDGKVQINGRWPDSDQALQIDTTRLWIDLHLHELSTDAGVTLSSVLRNGSATGLRADWMTRTLDLYADVKMTYDRSTH